MVPNFHRRTLFAIGLAALPALAVAAWAGPGPSRAAVPGTTPLAVLPMVAADSATGSGATATPTATPTVTPTPSATATPTATPTATGTATPTATASPTSTGTPSSDTSN